MLLRPLAAQMVKVKNDRHLDLELTGCLDPSSETMFALAVIQTMTTLTTMAMRVPPGAERTRSSAR